MLVVILFLFAIFDMFEGWPYCVYYISCPSHNILYIIVSTQKQTQCIIVTILFFLFLTPIFMLIFKFLLINITYFYWQFATTTKFLSFCKGNQRVNNRWIFVTWSYVCLCIGCIENCTVFICNIFSKTPGRQLYVDKWFWK